MLKEYALKYYDKNYDLNCAETIMYAANEAYNLNLPKEVFKTMSAFGGGLAVEEVCGAITGAAAVLGIMFTEERAHESAKIKELTKELMERFKKELNMNNCAELKAQYKKDDEVRCGKMIETSADILEDIINRERK
ncbi:C_GCAxxG_C_C family probable redox protein [Clostridium amylolyticum]|uniref:C_GCAxxG_C_C family probable redox protein n=1 Tax=Clostridium amylolyticum TaxID=1121298 RepID=A0A1M6I992_9CLOT|nr:C-GCAxxG-C-C family (seleno)protein [Clostridium amylolyticum]SHJ30918.1 C_GCAxxG_C_C family probable redox protein [Clostridium amylolyticum]